MVAAIILTVSGFLPAIYAGVAEWRCRKCEQVTLDKPLKS